MRKSAIVVGGGLAGLSCALKLAEQGIFVNLVSLSPAKRSHSVCAQGGINAAIDYKRQGDSVYLHAYETMKGGAFLANQPPILEMCMAAPSILKMLDRMGCLFNRTSEGNIDFRGFGGSLFHRTAYCGSTTGQQLVYSLDEQVRRYEDKGLVKRYEHHEFLKLILDDKKITRGIIIQDLYDLSISSLKSDCVVIATGGIGFLFQKSTNSSASTGAANGRLFMQGMKYANGEFIQIHPTAIPGQDKLRLVSEAVRSEGGRIWVYGDEDKMIKFPDGSLQSCGKKNKPWYFLEEMYPAYGNLVPRDIASQEILKICKLGLGIDGKMQVYLDITHLDEETLLKLESVLDIYKKFTSEDPTKVPMKIFPAVHYTMGGAWVDWPSSDAFDRSSRYRQMTNIKGLFNIGESDFQYHGANRLGANALLSCIFAGLVAAKEIPRYLDSIDKKQDLQNLFDQEVETEKNIQKDLLSKNGNENIHFLHDELADVMLKYVTVERNNDDLKMTLEKIKELEKRYENISLDDKQNQLNQTYVFARQFPSMIELAKIITKSALLRNESRGCHYKHEFDKRDDAKYLKTTIATYDTKLDEPVISYEDVDVRYIKPTKRQYLKQESATLSFDNLPKNVEQLL